MQDKHEQIKNAINELIAKSPKPNGQSLYYTLQDTALSLNDESGLFTTIWTTTIQTTKPDDPNYEDIMELETKLNDHIACLDIATLCNMTPDPLNDKQPNQSFHSNSSDIISFNFSDHCIYLITYASGQY